MKLNIKAFSLACALIWGLGVFFLTGWIIAFDGVSGEITFLGKVYRGYCITPLGSIIGLVWAFFDGLIGLSVQRSLRGSTIIYYLKWRQNND